VCVCVQFVERKNIGKMRIQVTSLSNWPRQEYFLINGCSLMQKHEKNLELHVFCYNKSES
jgi:hypothetical protein